MSYTANLALAQRLITAKGRSVTLEQLSAVGDDANKPWKPGTGGVPTVLNSFTVDAVFVPHTGLESLGLSKTDVELLRRCDQVALVAGHASDLSVCHRMTDDSMSWRIELIRVLKPGPLTILYVFGVCR